MYGTTQEHIVYANDGTVNMTVYSGTVIFPAESLWIDGMSLFGGTTQVPSNITLSGGPVTLENGAMLSGAGGLTFSAGTTGGVSLGAGSTVSLNGLLDLSNGTNTLSYALSIANVGNSSPLIFASTVNVPAGVGTVSMTISTPGTLPLGRYSLLGYGTYAGNSSPATTFSLGTSPPSGQNWALINGTNNQEVDLFVAGTANVQSTTAWSSTDSSHFGAAAAWVVPSGGSYAGLQSSATAVDDTSPGTGGMLILDGANQPLYAKILAGVNSGAFTSGAVGVTMAWRTPTAQESSTPTAPPLPSAVQPLLSNVLQLEGMGNGSVDPSQTDPFVLDMNYNPALLTGRIPERYVYLGWLNPNGGGAGVPQWQNATLGNFGNNTVLLGEDYQGSFAAFQAQIGDTNLTDYIGAYGVDTVNHEVWAVVNHNSDFAVVPEPSTFALVAAVAAGLVGYGLRKRRAARRTAKAAAFGQYGGEAILSSHSPLASAARRAA